MGIRRSAAPLLAVGLTLSAGLLLYLGAGALRLAERPLPTAECVRDVFIDAITLEGLVLREELPLTDGAPRRELLCAQGERVGRDAPLAIAYESAEEYFRARLYLRLRRELSVRESAAPPRARDAAAGLSAALALGDPQALPDAALDLRLALMPPAAELAPLRAELAALEAGGAAEHVVFAPASGLFSSETDGWEGISPALGRTLSPGVLECLAPAAPGEETWGRLVTGREWAFVAAAPEEDAARLIPGETIEAILPPEAGGAEVTLSVWSVGKAEEGRQTVSLLCSRRLEETLCLRCAALTLVFSRQEGLRLPASALREDERGPYVLRQAGAGQEPSAVTVLARRGDEILVQGDALRPGSRVILPGDGE